MNDLILKSIILGHSSNLSKEWMKTCINSCKQHGLPYEVLNHSIENMSAEEAYQSVGCILKTNIRNTYAMAHAMHILAWKRIIELDHACVILEHDAIVVNSNVYKLQVPDMTIVHLGHANPKTPEQTTGFNDFIRCRKRGKITDKRQGTHAYAITVNTARYLYEDAVNNGITMGVDNWLCQRHLSKHCGLPLLEADPILVRGWVRGSTT